MLRTQAKSLCSLLSPDKLLATQVCGLKEFYPPPPKKEIEYPERVKLRMLEKVPQYPPGIKPFKMQKRIRYMRGHEPIHNEFIHEQFGIISVRGGRLRYEHFEMIRLIFARRFKHLTNMFATWRVDAPWQPVSKKAQGVKKGGGKAPIDHYCTPVKGGRVILEVGGDIEWFQVKTILTNIANKMPFPSKALTHEQLLAEREEEARLERENINPWNWKYVIQNNLGGCHNNVVSPTDKIYYGKYA